MNATNAGGAERGPIASHRKPVSRRVRIWQRIGVTIAAFAVIVGAAEAVGAATGDIPSSGYKASNHGVYECINNTTHVKTANTTLANAGCPAGTHGFSFATGSQAPMAVTVAGTSNLTAWPESSGWATDAFTRSLTVTRSATEVDNANCNGAAHCWFYTSQLVDNGGFTTVNGAATPNGTGGTINGVFSGTMQGVASGSFYADSSALAAANIPTAANGSAKPASTTAWGTLVLPGTAHEFGVKLTAYSWTYKSATTCEQWVDAINPGDDGQSAADGNITGTVHCTV